MQEVFSFNFPLREFFFCTSPAPPPHKFSNGPSLNISSQAEIYTKLSAPVIFLKDHTRRQSSSLLRMTADPKALVKRLPQG